jgi:hypothetical protein
LKTAADQAANWTRRFVTSAWRAPAERSGCLVRQAACMSDGRHGPREVAARMANRFLLAVAALLIGSAVAFWDPYESLSWFLLAAGSAALAFAALASQLRKAPIRDAVVTLVMAPSFIA